MQNCEFDLINAELRANWVEVSLQLRNGGNTINIFNVYAPHGIQDKLILWQEFRRISVLLDSSPTIFIGDFNEVRFQRERSNCNSRPREMREFNKWIDDSNLVEFPLENANFTWIGPNGKRSRLDRAFANSVWPNLADWNLKVLPRKNSDHIGILLRARKQNWGPKPFRVFNVWLRNPSLKKELENFFSEPASLPNLNLHQILRNVKHVIKTWNLSVNGNIFHKISELEEKVAKLEEDNGPRNDLAILKMSLEELCLTRDSMLKQKAIVDWLKEGDRNTKFFHQVIQKRRARNSIKKLICNGRLSYDPLEIKQEIRRHFKQVFSKRAKFDIFSIKGLISQKISRLEVDSLERPVVIEELELALNQSGLDKAPGPDGLNAGTLKSLCRYLKDDLLAFVINFMASGELPSGMNSSFISLIPKVEFPLGPLDARFQVVEEDVAAALQVAEEEVEGMGEWLVQDLGSQSMGAQN
ncbi:hypothetical protein POM88_002745 [Heracleum sosnowskyi]|uniref:Endonuclease/exonuclease/phosphatase domain-containing protein n=1 Tax=Heracleum sosnowskyi TaxID=360622 RepID=A0AAD8N667_9APIA|nr:hypothetical protein POM88_002745 [Heracleum sosnowskyi]